MFLKTKNLSLAHFVPLSIALSVLLIAVSTYFAVSGAFAQSNTKQTNLQSELKSLDEQIENTEVQLDGIREERLTLEQTLTNLRNDIAQLKGQIDATKAQIAALELEIQKTQLEIDRQKEILASTFKELYQRSNTSTIELLVASDSFSQYLDTQEYLDRLKDGIAESVTLIQDLKAQLQAEEDQQKALLSEQEGQQVALSAVETQQQQLLEQTQGRESIFQAQLDELEAQHAAKESELNAYLASLISSKVNLGPISKGDVIGKLGNTGWSSGPHLHLEIYSGPGQYLEPLGTLQSSGWSWPVGGGGGYVSQRYSSGHKAVDIAGPQGTPLVAVADGTIIHRGCLYVGSMYSTFGVIIDHGNSRYSSYIHLMAPNNDKYSACNTNRRAGSAYFGQTSIDFSTTQ